MGKRNSAFIVFTIILLLLLQSMTSFASEDKERVIAHGGGAFQGYETTNSVEALNQAIRNGYKMIELDMELSSDGRIIMLHDWDRTATHYFGSSFPRKLSYNQFLQLSVHGVLEVLTFEKLARILDKNPDIRIVTDTKGDNIALLTEIKESWPKLMNRFLPQIYDCDQWRGVHDLGYKDIILTLYAMAELNPDQLAAFAVEHGIYAVTMPDYLADKGICKILSDRGITVYVHPISDYETAQKYMRQGAFGVYSGSLIPSEFDGIEAGYYLTVRGEDGTAVKLTDERIDDWKELKLHGQKPSETVLFAIDQSSQCADEQTFSELGNGEHKLSVSIFDAMGCKGTLSYFLWKDTQGLRILHSKYEYRLDTAGGGKDFHTVMREAGVTDEVSEILEQSLIAKEGEYAYYHHGNRETYMNGEEHMTTQKGSGGKLLLPLGTTLQRLGASTVTMSKDKDITIIHNGEKSMIMANTNLLRKGFRLTRLKTPVTLYLNKSMAGGEFYREITGRAYLEKDGIVILLPDTAEPNGALKDRLLQAAGKLF